MPNDSFSTTMFGLMPNFHLTHAVPTQLHSEKDKYSPTKRKQIFLSSATGFFASYPVLHAEEKTLDTEL